MVVVVLAWTAGGLDSAVVTNELNMLTLVVDGPPNHHGRIHHVLECVCVCF